MGVNLVGGWRNGKLLGGWWGLIWLFGVEGLVRRTEREVGLVPGYAGARVPCVGDIVKGLLSRQFGKI